MKYLCWSFPETRRVVNVRVGFKIGGGGGVQSAEILFAFEWQMVVSIVVLRKSETVVGGFKEYPV